MAVQKYLSLERLEEYDGLIKTKIDSKQDILTGAEGQFVQFDSSGKPIATDPILITINDIDVICESLN